MQREDRAATGYWGSVVWAVDASGNAPAREFFLNLRDEDAAKIEALFKRLANFGRISNKEQFKGRAIWEFNILSEHVSGRRRRQ